MSIENSLERIASALEALAGNTTAATPEPSPKETASTPAKGKTKSKSAASQQPDPDPSLETPKEASDLDGLFGEDTPAEEEKPAKSKDKVKEPALDDVRNKLVEVQVALKGKDHAIALLKKFTTGNAATLTALPEAKFAKLLAAADDAIKTGKV